MLHSGIGEIFTKLLQRCYKFSQNEVNDGMKLFYNQFVVYAFLEKTATF